MDPKDYTYAEKYRLKEYQDARKYISVGTMLGAIVIIAGIVAGVSLTNASNGYIQIAFTVLGVLVAGGFLLTLFLSIMIESIKASLEAVEARLRDEDPNSGSPMRRR